MDKYHFDSTMKRRIEDDIGESYEADDDVYPWSFSCTSKRSQAPYLLQAAPECEFHYLYKFAK